MNIKIVNRFHRPLPASETDLGSGWIRTYRVEVKFMQECRNAGMKG